MRRKNRNLKNPHVVVSFSMCLRALGCRPISDDILSREVERIMGEKRERERIPDVPRVSRDYADLKGGICEMIERIFVPGFLPRFFSREAREDSFFLSFFRPSFWFFCPLDGLYAWHVDVCVQCTRELLSYSRRECWASNWINFTDQSYYNITGMKIIVLQDTSIGLCVFCALVIPLFLRYTVCVLARVWSFCHNLCEIKFLTRSSHPFFN